MPGFSATRSDATFVSSICAMNRCPCVRSGARYYPFALSTTHTIADFADTIAAPYLAEAPQYRPRVDMG